MSKVLAQKGNLFLIGGAEDRKGDKVVLKHLVEQTTPENIIIIPTASSHPRDVGRCYSGTFMDLGVKFVQCLDIRYHEEANKIENIEAIEKADLIFLGGGDQAKLVDTLKHTKLFNRMKYRFESNNLHIAGTSAGASAIGNPIFYNGDRKGFIKGSIDISEGFGLIDGVAVDTHFSTRHRLDRLCQFLIGGKCRKGIGLDEDTGIMIYPNLHFKVIGTGMVAVVNSANASGSNYLAARNGDKLKFNNMRVGYLPPGSRFSIKKWSIVKSTTYSHKKLDYI